MARGRAGGRMRRVDEAVKQYGDVNSVVTCAGVEKHGFGHEFSEEDFDRIIAVNLKGTWLSARSAVRAMIAAGHGGTVVMIGSINSIVGNPGASASSMNREVAFRRISNTGYDIGRISGAHHTQRAHLVQTSVAGVQPREQVIATNLPGN